MDEQRRSDPAPSSGSSMHDSPPCQAGWCRKASGTQEGCLFDPGRGCGSASVCLIFPPLRRKPVCATVHGARGGGDGRFLPFFLTRGLVQSIVGPILAGGSGKSSNRATLMATLMTGRLRYFARTSRHALDAQGLRGVAVTKTRTIWRWRRGGPSTARSRPRCSRSTPTGTSRAKGGATCCMV